MCGRTHLPQEMTSGQDIMPYIMRPVNLPPAMYAPGARLYMLCSRREAGKNSLQESRPVWTVRAGNWRLK